MRVRRGEKGIYKPRDFLQGLWLSDAIDVIIA